MVQEEQVKPTWLPLNTQSLTVSSEAASLAGVSSMLQKLTDKVAIILIAP